MAKTKTEPPPVDTLAQSTLATPPEPTETLPAIAWQLVPSTRHVNTNFRGMAELGFTFRTQEGFELLTAKAEAMASPEMLNTLKEMSSQATKEFSDLREQMASMSRALEGLQLQVAALDHDNQDVIASGLRGEPLAIKLAAYEQERRSLMERSQNLEDGKRVLGEKVNQAWRDAEKDLQEHARRIQARMTEMASERRQSVIEKIKAAVPADLLSELCVLETALTFIHALRQGAGGFREVAQLIGTPPAASESAQPAGPVQLPSGYRVYPSAPAAKPEPAEAPPARDFGPAYASHGLGGRL